MGNAAAARNGREWRHRQCPGTGRPPTEIHELPQYWTHGPHKGHLFCFGRGICSHCGRRVGVSTKMLTTPHIEKTAKDAKEAAPMIGRVTLTIKLADEPAEVVRDLQRLGFTDDDCLHLLGAIEPARNWRPGSSRVRLLSAVSITATAKGVKAEAQP